jgi:hypothetical protein
MGKNLRIIATARKRPRSRRDGVIKRMFNTRRNRARRALPEGDGTAGVKRGGFVRGGREPNLWLIRSLAQHERS